MIALTLCACRRGWAGTRPQAACCREGLLPAVYEPPLDSASSLESSTSSWASRSSSLPPQTLRPALVVSSARGNYEKDSV